MTNSEKFEQIFGFVPDHISVIPCRGPKNCKYHSDDRFIGCHCDDWWDEEFEEVADVEN